MNELPLGWIEIPLGEELNCRKGKKPNELFTEINDDLVPYVDIKAFEKNQVRQYAKPSDGVLADKHDSLMVWDGARSGLIGNGIAGVIGSTLMRITPKTSDRKYLHHFLKSKYNEINHNPRGAGIPHVNPDLLFGFDYSYPPLNEQKRIADKLDTVLARVDAAHERLDRIPNILKQFRQSVLASATSGKLTEEWRESKSLGDVKDYIEYLREVRISALEKTSDRKSKLPEPSSILDIEAPAIPDGWVYVSLSSLSTRVTYGLTVRPAYVKTGVPVISAKEIRSGKVDYEFANLISIADYKIQREKCKIFNGDVLFSKTGSIGHVAIANQDIPACSSQNIAVVTPLINEKYLACIFRSPYIQDLAQKSAMGNAVPDLQLGVLSQFPIPLPTEQEQKEIVRRVETLFALADKLEARYLQARARVEKLTPALFAKAFRGELVEQDPNDEPAEKLLERVKAEKAVVPVSKSKAKKAVVTAAEPKRRGRKNKVA